MTPATSVPSFPGMTSNQPPHLRLLASPESRPTMPPDHAADLHERGEDRIVELLKAMNAAQDRNSAQILAQLGAVQVELKTLTKADNDNAIAMENLRGELKRAKDDAIEAKTLANTLKEQVLLWRGVTVAVGGLLAAVGTFAAVAKLFVHP
jgi:hypothetical protein